MKQYVHNETDRDEAETMLKNKRIGEFGFMVEILQTITPKQMDSLHLWFGLLATELNKAGLEIEMKFLGKEIRIPWSKDEVKKRIWLPPMEAMTGKTSTTKLQRPEVGAIYDVLNVYFGEIYSLHVPFPEDKPPLPDVPK
jgi:hypothetical protein